MWATGATTPACVHLCPEGCSREAEGPGLLHCSELRSVKTLEELVGVPWRDVLLEGRPKGEDELAGLRSKMDGIGGPSPGAVAAAAEIEEKEKKERAEKEKKRGKKKKKKKRKRGRSSRSKSEASKKEKAKKRRTKRRKDTGKSPGSSSSSTSSSSSIEFKAVTQEVMFRGSGMDPNARIRRKQRRRAQRLARRSQHTKDESKSASSDDGGELALKGDQVFGEPQRIRGIALQFPGVLSAQAIEQMQDHGPHHHSLNPEQGSTPDPSGPLLY